MLGEMSHSSVRLASLDALRGLDMLCILGVDTLVVTLAPLFPESEGWKLLRGQFGHVEWKGFTVYDLVFPLFVFLAGVSLAFSLRRQAALGRERWRMFLKLLRRALVLVVLGWLVNGPLSWQVQEMRFASVLGLIGISGLAAGAVVLAAKGRVAVAVTAAALLTAAVGAAQYGGGDLTPDGSVNAYLDGHYLIGRLHDGPYDPEGLLCLVSATALALVGYAAGRVLMLGGLLRRLLLLGGVGALLLAAGWQLPVIKRIWTPGFVLCCAGCGMLLTALFHVAVDVCRFRAWSLPLQVVGCNALAAYLISHLFDWWGLSVRLSAGTWSCLLPAEWVRPAVAATMLLLLWGLCSFLYRQGVRIKV